MPRDKVWIVNAGGFASSHAAQGDYAEIIEHIKESLLDLKLTGRPITVEVVTDTSAALIQSLIFEDEAVIVFVTRGMLDVAQDVKRENDSLRVVLLSSAPPRKGEFEDGVVVIDKLDLVDREDVPRLILGEEPVVAQRADVTIYLKRQLMQFDVVLPEKAFGTFITAFGREFAREVIHGPSPAPKVIDNYYYQGGLHVQVSIDVSQEQQFYDFLRSFCNGQVLTVREEDLVLGHLVHS